MKLKLWMLGAAAAALFMLTACGAPAPVAFAVSDISIRQNEAVQLTYMTAEDDAVVTFSSSDATVVSVDQNGVILGVGIGKATVIASVGEYEKAYLEVTVAPDTMNSEWNIILGSTSLELIRDLDFTLSAEVRENGETVPDVQFTWSSSDEMVATVDNGRIHAVAPGPALITVRAEAGDRFAEAVCAVTVYEYYRVELAEEGIRAPIGKEFTLTASVYDRQGQPVHVDEKDLIWITSDSSAISVIGNVFKIISIGSPSVGVRYKGNVTSIPVDIFSVSASFFADSAKDFYGEVEGETFSGVEINSTVYQPSFYFSREGVEAIRQYAAESGYSTLRIHSYAILLDNGFVINGRHTRRGEWSTTEFPIESISEEFRFWSQSQGKTQIYLWFELL